MAKLPLDDPKTGTHRAKLWEIGFYALNNTSTNAYMILVASISYFLVGIVGVASVLAGSIVTIMRIWDGVTDPFIGMLVDNTNTKFGKNRPFIVIGNVIVFLAGLMDTTGQLGELLAFDAALFLHGQFWRLITFALVPVSSWGILGFMITLYFYYFIGSTMEREWGQAKFSLYFFSGMLFGVSQPSTAAMTRQKRFCGWP